MMAATVATPIPAATARRFKRVAFPPEASRSRASFKSSSTRAMFW